MLLEPNYPSKQPGVSPAPARRRTGGSQDVGVGLVGICVWGVAGREDTNPGSLATSVSDAPTFARGSGNWLEYPSFPLHYLRHVFACPFVAQELPFTRKQIHRLSILVVKRGRACKCQNGFIFTGKGGES